MSKSDDLSSISSTEKAEREVDGDSDFPASESAAANINLCLSLGGSYGEDSKETTQMGGVKCVALNRSSSVPVRAKWPEKWAVESASRNAAFCRAMDKLKSKTQDRRQITGGKEGETSRATVEKPAKKAKVIKKNDAILTALDIVKLMPSVTTIGDGAKGKRIEGFLFKYKQGLEIDIMCICHGQIMSPLEFVKHAGGTEIENPMKCINVLATTL